MPRIWAVSQWQRTIEGHHVLINLCHCPSSPLVLLSDVVSPNKCLLPLRTSDVTFCNLSVVVCCSWSGVPGSRSTALSSASQTPEARRTLNRWWAASCECRPTSPTSDVFKNNRTAFCEGNKGLHVLVESFAVSWYWVLPLCLAQGSHCIQQRSVLSPKRTFVQTVRIFSVSLIMAVSLFSAAAQSHGEG